MYAFTSPVERFVLRYIMEQCAYMAVDYEAEVNKAKSNARELETTVSLKQFEPTENMIRCAFVMFNNKNFLLYSEFTVGAARFTCAEGVHNPKRWSLDCQGLQKLIYGAIQTAPMDSRRALYK